MNENYYKAYDDRYRQVHSRDLLWFSENPSDIVNETMREYGISLESGILEIGCGEGRDAYPLLKLGYDLLATDVSPEAVAFCRRKFPEFANRFRVVDCLADKLNAKFDFIYAVAVLHMLVPDKDRVSFFKFIREHLSSTGIALICTMGDGDEERSSDIAEAFDIQERIHDQTGTTVNVAATSCRVVNFSTFESEIERGGLEIIKKGITSVEPDFPQMMFAVVGRSS